MLLSQKKLFGTNCFISNTACRLQIQTMNLEKDPESVHSLDKKKVLVTQSCLTPCNSIYCSPPGSSVHRILQARIPEWVAIPFSRGSSRPRNLGLLHCRQILYCLSHQGSLAIKNLPANAGDTGDVGLIPGSGRSPGEGNDNPLQDSCLENSMDRGAWRATVCGVAKSQT